MNNKDIFLTDPSTRKLVNEGVANVSDIRSDKALDVLKYELDTFVCSGQYEKGLELILETYLRNIDQAQQPAVWISGFFGSGKSHLVKMLGALWEDTKLQDGSTAREIAELPQNIKDHLKELSMEGKRHGGLHVASGTLGSGRRGSVRLALLSFIFSSKGLPEHYNKAQFVLWLKKDGIYDEVRNQVERAGFNWIDELDNLLTSETISDALMKAKPSFFTSPAICLETLNNQYPFANDVSNEEMVKAIKQALAIDGIFPLTLIVIDEIEQFIGMNSQRANEVQEMVEACCKNIGGKLLFVGTGQTAVIGTANLKKLAGRFTIRIELSDTDVDSVVRKVLLLKKPDSKEHIDEVIQKNLGEISRHLANTTLGHRQDDAEFFVADYPILPVRRRFWEHSLRILDQSGTDSQLRNQLKMVHKVIRTNLDEPLGNVVPADYLFFDSTETMLKSYSLPRKLHENTIRWRNGSEEEVLKARACGTIFLINKLAAANKDIGIKATVDTIADLMVTDLSQGSGSLRSKLPTLLDNCDLVMKVGDEYRIQTDESTAWNDTFKEQESQLANQSHRIEAERNDTIRRKFNQTIKRIAILQGKSRIKRDIHPVFDSSLPNDHNEMVYIWVRHGWDSDENSVSVDARQAGNESSTVFIFIPKRSADDLWRQIMEYKAANAVLEIKGVPNTPEGREARAYMDTRKQSAEGKINELLDEALSSARVFQGGGTEITGTDLKEMIQEASENAVERLYPDFHIADNINWNKVYEKAKKGASDALHAVGDKGEPANNPICKAILSYIGAGQNGADVRKHFEKSPYGWSRDAVDGGLQVLLIAGLIHAKDERSKPLNPKEIDRRQMGKALFRVESNNVTVPQRIQVRIIMQKMRIQAKANEEVSSIPDFLEIMNDLAERAGGEPPKPFLVDTSILSNIRRTSGNEQIITLYNNREELSDQIDLWTEQAKQIEDRWPSWLELLELLEHGGDLQETRDIDQQVKAIKSKRLLITKPDPINPLLKALKDTLRKELKQQVQRFSEILETQRVELECDSSWQILPKDDKDAIFQKCEIGEVPVLNVATHTELVDALKKNPINVWNDRIHALTRKFEQAREMAIKALEPEAQTVDIPRRTLKNQDDIRKWLNEVEVHLNNALKKGPVLIK